MAKTPVVTASGTEATAATAPPQSPPPPISTHMSHPSQSSHTCTSQISTKKVKSKVHHHSHLISNPTTVNGPSLPPSLTHTHTHLFRFYIQTDKASLTGEAVLLYYTMQDTFSAPVPLSHLLFVLRVIAAVQGQAVYCRDQ